MQLLCLIQQKLRITPSNMPLLKQAILHDEITLSILYLFGNILYGEYNTFNNTTTIKDELVKFLMIGVYKINNSF